MNQRKIIKSYKDLEVYQLSYRLAVEIDKMTKQLPKHEFWEEGQQIRKSSGRRRRVNASHPAIPAP